jgi:hypothetical protein
MTPKIARNATVLNLTPDELHLETAEPLIPALTT